MWIRMTVLLLSILCGVIPSVLIGIDFPSQIYIPILLFIGSFILIYIIFFTTLFVIGKIFEKRKNFAKQSKAVNFFFNETLELLCHFGRVKIHTTGLEKLPQNQKFLVVYNHRSNFDPMVQSLVMRKYNLIHISKKENFKIPIAGGFMYREKYLYLDRENVRSAVSVINSATQYLKNNQFCIGIAPEGTRNKEGKEVLLPFKHGSFRVALLAKCPIVVCSLHGFEKIHKNFPLKRTHVEMNVLDVLDYDQIKDLSTAEISDKVHAMILEDLNKYYK